MKKKKKAEQALPPVIYARADDDWGWISSYEKPEQAAPTQGTVELGRYVLEGRVFVTTKTEVTVDD